MVKKTKKIKKVKDAHSNCCPHRSLPRGKSWEQAKKEGWLWGADKHGDIYFCPKSKREVTVILLPS